MGKSILEQAAEYGSVDEVLSRLSEEERERARYDWRLCARPEQLPPEGAWRTWLVLAGRGFGKTRCATEWVRSEIEHDRAGRVAMVAATAADARDVLVEGESGLLAISPPHERPLYEPSKRRVTYQNGATVTLFSAEEPDRLRGPQFDAATCFVEQTQILTPNGQVSIESLAIGDQVLTRRGVRRIRNVVSRVADVGTVRFSDGQELTGTAEHPIWSNGNWIAMGNLSIGSRVLTATGMRILERQESTTGISEDPSTAIDGFGNCITVPFQLTNRSIISMAILQITLSKILSVLRSKSIDTFTVHRAAARGYAHRERMFPVQTVNVKLVDLFTSPRLPFVFDASTVEQSQNKDTNSHAPIVEKNLLQSLGDTVVDVVATWEPAGVKRVYNIEVENEHEYFANDKLVHNCDELAAWSDTSSYDMLQFGLRLGKNPRCVVTTTPRPTAIIRQLLKDKNTVVSRGTTFENASNLAPAFLDSIRQRYEGTRLGRQELMAEVLDDVEGALWKWEMFTYKPIPLQMKRIVVGVDPAGSAKKTADEAGIVVMGLADCHCLGRPDQHAWVLEDATGRYSPRDMGEKAISLYRKWQADLIIAEVNFGGEMVRDLMSLIDASVPFKDVRSSRGKIIRAEPIAAMYEKNRIHHAKPFKHLEEQLCEYAPLLSTESPGAMDSMVFAASELMLSFPVTLGEGPITCGSRRASVDDSDGDDDDDEDEGNDFVIRSNRSNR